ncbi:MAG: peptidoglycan DD-metalloendopeptidase family protein [Chloroflexota bacterium]
MRKLSLTLTAILVFITAFQPVSAQTATPPAGPVYIIQEGDTLWEIAYRFNITFDELVAANPDIDPDFISVGQQLVIPGLEGITGVLTTEVVALGETFRSLSRRYQVSTDILQRLNRIVSPTELYAGVSLVVPVTDESAALKGRVSLGSGETMLELAARQNANPWSLAGVNETGAPGRTLPKDILYTWNETSDAQASGLPPAFQSIEVSPLPLVQGMTTEIIVATSARSLTGTLVDYPLQFFGLDAGKQVALQGVHAMLEPGLYPLTLTATLEDGSQQSFEQMVLVASGFYPDDPDLYIMDASTIDVEVSDTEFAQVLEIALKVTPERYWQGLFTSPASLFPEPECYTSRFGNRRTYKTLEGETRLLSFHSGQDFCGGTGLPITAAAPGMVVFAGPLTVRGNATIIDHGWGIFTGYYHQSEILVSVGEQVESGQLIGYVGATGRVTGGHLHWEVWVNGIQVNPLTWLEQQFP